MITHGFREFIRPRIPIISEANSPADSAAPVAPPVDIEVKWGAASFLNFNLQLGPQDPIRKPPGFVVRGPENELIERHGRGREQAVDHDGEVVAEGRILNSLTLFFIREFDEVSEEVKTVGNLTVITPTIKHVTLYTQWTDVANFGESQLEQHLKPTP